MTDTTKLKYNIIKMKKIIITLLIFSASLTSNLFAQNLSSDFNHLKATNNLWSACYSFNKVMSSQNQSKERLIALPLLKSNIESARKYFIQLKTKFPNDTDLKQLDLWIKTMEKSLEGLNSKKWNSDTMWQMGFTLIEMDLRDFVNGKLK